MKKSCVFISTVTLLFVFIQVSAQTIRPTEINGITAKPGINQKKAFGMQSSEKDIIPRGRAVQNVTGNTAGFIRVNNTIDEYGTSQILPLMAEGKEGKRMVAWIDNRNGLNDIYAQMIDKDGQKIGGNLRINENVNSLWNYGYSIDANSNGEFIIVWAEYGDRIMAQKINPLGKPDGKNIILDNNDYSNNNSAPFIKFNNKGNYVVAWSKNSHIKAHFYNSAGKLISTEVEIGYPYSGLLLDKVAADPSGNFGFVYSASEDGVPKIYFKYFSDTGIQIGQTYLVSYKDTSIPCFSPEVFCSSDGVFCVKWNILETANNQLELTRVSRCQLINPATGYVGYTFELVRHDWMTNTSGTSDKYNNFIFATPSGTYIDIIKVSSSGNIIRNDNRIDLNLPDGFISDCKIGVDIYGELGVAWSDNRHTVSGVYYEKFDANFSKTSMELEIPQDIGSAFQVKPQIAVQPDGRFLVSWIDERNGYKSLYATLFNYDRNPFRENFQLNRNEIASEYYSPCYILKPDKKNNYLLLFINLAGDVILEKLDKNGTLLYEKKIYDKLSLNNIGKLGLTISDDNKIIVCVVGYKKQAETFLNGLVLQTYSEDFALVGNEGFYSLGNYDQAERKDLVGFCVNNKSELLVIYRNYNGLTSELSNSIFCDIFYYNSKKANNNITLFQDISSSDFSLRCEYDKDGNFILCWHEKNYGNFTTKLQFMTVNSLSGKVTSKDVKGDYTYIDYNFDLIKDNYDNLLFLYKEADEYKVLRITKSFEADGVPEILLDHNYGGYFSAACQNGKIYSVFDAALTEGSGRDVYLFINSSFEKYAPKDPIKPVLYNNYPNPFNSSTLISYSLPVSSQVSLKIYNSIGQEITSLVNQVQGAGYYQIPFESKKLPSGVYFYKLTTSYSNNSQKMIILK